VRAVVLPAVAATAACAGIAAAAYAVVATLPAPQPGLAPAVRLLKALPHAHESAAIVHLDGRTLDARCYRRGAVRVIDAGGRRVVLHRTRIERGPTTFPLPQAVALTDLVGIRALVGEEIAGRARAGLPLVAGRARVSGRRAILLRLAGSPAVVVAVDAATGRPLALRFASRRASGWSTLGAPAPAPSRELVSAHPGLGAGHAC